MGAVTEAVRQVGADGGQDARTEAPACQGRHGLVAPVGVEDEHAGGQDQAVNGEREKPGGHAALAVRADQLVSVAVGDDRGHGRDRGHCEGGGDADEAVGHANSSRSSIPAPAKL